MLPRFQSSSSLVRRKRRRGGPLIVLRIAPGFYSVFLSMLLAYISGVAYYCRHMQNKRNQLRLTPHSNQQYDGIFVISLQGTPNADPHNDGRLDNFKEAWRKSCGTDPEMHLCPGVIGPRGPRPWTQWFGRARRCPPYPIERLPQNYPPHSTGKHVGTSI